MENGGRIIKMSTVKDGPFAKAYEGKKSSRLIVKFDNGDTAQIDIIQGASETRFSVHADDGRDMFDDSNDVLGEARAVYDAWHNSDGSAKHGYMLAPNGKPTNLTERQWIQVRTPSFKKWFGDWETNAKAYFILNQEDISSDGEMLKIAATEQRAKAKEIYDAIRAQGHVTTNDGRSVGFSGRGFRELRYHSADPHTLAITPILRDVIGSANYFGDGDTEVVNGETFKYHLYARRVNLGDGSMIARIVIREDANGNMFYDGESTSLESIKGIVDSVTGKPNVGRSQQSPHAPHSLAEYFSKVNRGNVSKVVDENGEPKVFYHGTFENWTEYDLQKNVNQMWGNGIYLTPYPERARLYGDNIMAFYVKADTDYRTAKTTGKQKDYTVIKQTEDIIVYSPNQIKSATDNNGAFDNTNPDIRYSLVTDEAKIKELEEGDTMKVYRAMQLVDGKLYPPMSGKINGKWREPIQLGKWEQSEERPDLIGKDGKFKLNKGNGSTIGAAYNPYFHTSTSPLNDQFSSAYKRPELVTVEVEIPVSELTSGYKAKGAKDAVGKVDWHSGSTTASLGGRDVYLSRYDKPIRIVPESEVAKVIAERARGKNITFKTNTVTPKLKDALKAEGLRFDDMVDGGNRFSVHSDVGSAMFDDSNDVLGEARAVYDAWHDSDGNAKPGYMLAPNGKPTNLTERQWIQVRTPSFKKWFGDWESLAEIDHAVDFCLNGNPVSELTGKEFQKNGEHDLVDRITEFFKSIGGVVENNELGVVVLDRESVKSSIGHGIGRSKAAAFAAVPDVIRDGVLFDRQKNWKGRGTNTYVIAAPIRIGSENYVCEAIVEEKVGRKAERRFYLHEVNLQSTVSDTIKTPTGGVGIGNPSRPVRSILARKAVEFNRKDVSKVVDENGEPKVVYHGTPHGGHTVFNGSKNGSYSYSVDGTTFFSSSQNVAMSYSTDPKTKYSDLPKSAIEDARRYIGSSHSEVRKEDNGRFYVYLDGEYVANSDADTLETALEKAAVSIASSMEKNQDSMTYSVFLSVKNPVAVDFNGGSWRGERSADGYYDNSVPIIAERAKMSGHDGLIVKNVQDAANILGRGIADDYAVFSQSQIKSATDNNGAFDNTNPDIRYSIGGVRGASALGIRGVADAEAMEKDGMGREDIWRKTGWWRGKDGKWRVEIPDVKRKAWNGDPEERHFTGGGEDFYRYKLTEIVRDNGLFDAYPSLKKIKVEFHKNMPANIGGNFNEETLTIKMPQKFHLAIDWAKEGLGDGKSAELNEAGRKTIVHELQHAIQLFEGLAKGGSPTEPVRPYALDDKTGHALSVFSEAVGMDPTNAGELAIIAYWAKKIASDQIGDDVPKRLAEKFETAANEAGKTPQEFRDEIERFYDSKTETPVGQYFKLEGEVEARNVKTRLGMTPEERAATPPWDTEDVPEDRQIVRFSVTAADDSAYMDAVNRGDMETAARMVDDAFDKSEGYRDETGQYHYRESVHAVGYRIGRIPSGGRSYNTREGRYEEGVSLIGVGNLPPVQSFAISELRDAGAKIVYLEGDVLTTTGGDDEFLMKNAKPITRKTFDKALITDAQKIAEKTLADKKWDTLARIGSYRDATMKWANASKAITLDPVTYDDNGNVIPLSQRFNHRNSDVRFSINIPEDGLSRAEAKAAIDTLKGKSYTNRETGISARLSSTGAGKLIGNAATGKTQANGFSKEQHNALAAMIDELFENAYFVSSKPDDDGDKNIASIKRFVCPVTVADTEAGAYITIKESVQHGHRIYSIDGIKIEELSPMVRRVIADRNAAESSSSFSLPQSAYVVNVGTRFSISAQEDADYLAAVNRGDMETAARMVREAAAKAMPDTKAVDENGDPLVVYHSTDADFPSLPVE